MTVKDGSRKGRVTGINPEPRDTTGARSQVLATIGVCVSRSLNWRESCEFANVAAALACAKVGSHPTRSHEIVGYNTTVAKRDKQNTCA